MDTDDKELFESALNDQVVQEVAADEPAAEVTTEQTGQPRDEHGRFAPKEQAEVAPAVEAQPAAEPAKEEAFVPSWRLREIREEREAAERRFAEAQAQWQRQIAELQARLPKEEPKQVPDVFENPNAFLEHGVRQAVDPINSKVAKIVENFSRKMAIKEHGKEKVDAAYNWLAQGMQTRNPEAVAVYQRVMASDDPFEEIVGAYQKQAVFQQIGNDPNAWFEKQLEERLSKDQAFAGSILQKIQQSARPTTPQGQQKINLPPSLNRVPSAQAAVDDDNDASDAALFQHAMR